MREKFKLGPSGYAGGDGAYHDEDEHGGFYFRRSAYEKCCICESKAATLQYSNNHSSSNAPNVEICRECIEAGFMQLMRGEKGHA